MVATTDRQTLGDFQAIAPIQRNAAIGKGDLFHGYAMVDRRGENVTDV